MHSGSHARTYTAGGAIPKRRLLKFSADGIVVLATAATDDIIGVSPDVDTASGEQIDVYRSGPVEVEFGGTVARGKDVTADANGKAVLANPAAGATCRVAGGGASKSHVAGDVGLIWLFPAQKTTPA